MDTHAWVYIYINLVELSSMETTFFLENWRPHFFWRTEDHICSASKIFHKNITKRIVLQIMFYEIIILFKILNII